MSRDIIFIADYFLGDFLGGAEMANEELISLLISSGNSVEKMLCRDVTPHYIEENKDKYFIVSNFMTLGGRSKEALIDLGCHYSLFEHDHKYVANRNPGVFPEYKAPEDFIVFRELYENAVTVVCQSKLHEEVMQKNLNISHMHQV